MNFLDSHLTFVGVDEDNGRLRCGFLTDLIDDSDMPLTALLEGPIMTLTLAAGTVIQFRVPDSLIVCLNQNADFWIANIGGSENAWQIEVDFETH
jgi:hypothetical protein